MSQTYVREKAAVAMHCLAVSDHSLPARLADASISGLDRLRHEDLVPLDPEVRDTYALILRRLGDQPSEGARPGALIAAERLSREDALDTARAIANLHTLVMRIS